MGIKILETCRNCNTCNMVLCPAGDVKKAASQMECFECGACTLACPYNSIILKKSEKEKFKVKVEGKVLRIGGLIKDALKAAGMKVGKLPEDEIFAPCECGGCWACAVKVNGKAALSCITPLAEGMEIETGIEAPLRMLSGFGAHMVGGVGTPYYLKNSFKPIEVVGFTHGCNLRCPQCQNHQIAFTAAAYLLEPAETSDILLGLESMYNTGTVTFSGGECTLNRRWLIDTIKNIHRGREDLNIHVDTNGTILSTEYIDELVDAGMNQIGIDVKALRVPTFQFITGIRENKIAKKYLKNSWNAVKYIVDNYPRADLYIGVGIPYNKALISLDEIREMGSKLSDIDPQIQVCVLDYRPEFRRREIRRPSFREMIKVKEILNREGLRTVIVQTTHGHIGP